MPNITLLNNSNKIKTYHTDEIDYSNDKADIIIYCCDPNEPESLTEKLKQHLTNLDITSAVIEMVYNEVAKDFINIDRKLSKPNSITTLLGHGSLMGSENPTEYEIAIGLDKPIHVTQFGEESFLATSHIPENFLSNDKNNSLRCIHYFGCEASYAAQYSDEVPAESFNSQQNEYLILYGDKELQTCIDTSEHVMKIATAINGQDGSNITDLQILKESITSVPKTITVSNNNQKVTFEPAPIDVDIAQFKAHISSNLEKISKLEESIYGSSTKNDSIIHSISEQTLQEYKLRQLLNATSENKIADVRSLLNQDLSVNTSSSDKESLLHISATEGYLELTNLLLKKGAKVNASNIDGVSPLYGACQFGNKEVVDTLIAHKADVNQCNNIGSSPLNIACLSNDNSAIVKKLLQNGAKVNHASQNGHQPIYLAARSGDLESVNLLLDSGAEVDKVSEDGFSAIAISTLKNDEQVTASLLQKRQKDSPPVINEIFLENEEYKEAIFKGLKSTINYLTSSRTDSWASKVNPRHFLNIATNTLPPEYQSEFKEFIKPRPKEEVLEPASKKAKLDSADSYKAA